MPNGEYKDVTQVGVASFFGLSKQSSIPSMTFSFDNPNHGIWGIKIVSKETPQSKMEGAVESTTDLSIMLENDSDYKIMSYLSTYHLTEGEKVGFVSRLYDQKEFEKKKQMLRGTVRNEREFEEILPDALSPKVAPMEVVDMNVVYPDGKEHVIHMKDDGKSQDEAELDNVYGGHFVAEQPGKYYARVVARGKTPEGEPFIRTTHHMFTVVDERLTINDKANAKYDSEHGMLEIDIHIESDSIENKFKLMGNNDDDMVNLKFKAYAELFGKTETGHVVPISFTSGMTYTKRNGEGQYSLKLKLSTKWMVRAGIMSKVKDTEFELRNVYIQDVSVSVPLASRDTIKLNIKNCCRTKMLEHFMNRHEVVAFNGLLSEDMLMGVRPEKYRPGNLTRASGHKLILSHGYCAEGSPFPAEDFNKENNVELFDDPNANRNNDDFAIRLGTFAEAFDSFSVVAHSQGGLASLHLLSYYWSGFDMNEESDPNSRLIQSVGSPYQGTAIAGWGDIGKALNVACGTNQDLTRDGAKLWLSGIPEAARKHVYYYTTSYKDWHFCNVVSQTVLSWPNDGATELKNAGLPGGHDMGNTKKQCHADGMNYPNQCKDAKRNAVMSKAAAK
eukprot:CAMPEP_0117422914 /NCGR_PEP_ID=MMETSP0758-20121206/3672_1 /TAXON_ID=63605 /ORGANISM="Percolomonas cosmopolitus, Strain AE-1 (ATCC 50343)" /LENGTH=614 /DNA_ID=CAMNT_0005205847 /DNA_START=360 /DNA_END=2204 /DNA_ORIENTATION=-